MLTHSFVIVSMVTIVMMITKNNCNEDESDGTNINYTIV